MTETEHDSSDERFTSRLEAFSDLVFGFSLSLLATRLDVPSRAEEIFDPGRWFAIIATFGFVCRFWLEHYRVFRHHFVAHMFDAIVNFIFLFGIAVLPYAVQTFLRFGSFLPSFALYVGDVSLIFMALSVLRLRGLRQRRHDPDVAGRLRDWRRTVLHCALALVLLGLICALYWHGGGFKTAMHDLVDYLLIALAAALLAARYFVRRLPGFLT